MEKEPKRQIEQEREPYYLASHFKTKEEAAEPYYVIQETIRLTDCDLSAYRFMQQWEDASENPWYVVVIGEKPPDEMHQSLTTALSHGEMISVPEDALDVLLVRRAMEITKGSWVEGHYGEKGVKMTGIKFSRRPSGRGHKRRKH